MPTYLLPWVLQLINLAVLLDNRRSAFVYAVSLQLELSKPIVHVVLSPYISIPNLRAERTTYQYFQELHFSSLYTLCILFLQCPRLALIG